MTGRSSTAPGPGETVVLAWTLVDHPPRPSDTQEAQDLFEEAHRRRHDARALIGRPSWWLRLPLSPSSHFQGQARMVLTEGHSVLHPRKDHRDGIGRPHVVAIDNDAVMTLIDFSTGARKTVTLPHRLRDYPDAILATGG